MAYNSPLVGSSYAQHDLGRVIYNEVIKAAPKTVVEFGVLRGYSTVCIAQALRDQGFGHVTSYDLWDSHPYQLEDKADVQKRIDSLGLSEWVTLETGSIWDILPTLPSANFYHIDVGNDGSVLKFVERETREARLNGSVVLFEGGSAERDMVKWMVEAKKVPMRGSVEYEILDPRRPSISKLC